MDEATRLIGVNRKSYPEARAVNPPVVRTSTVLYPDLATMKDHRQRRDTGERLFTYGARGTPTAFALEDAFCELEQGDRAFLYPSGLFALAALFLAYTEPGDHVAIIDSVYPPVRALAEKHFGKRGVTFSYFRPDTDSFKAALRKNTRLALLESPGSNTFEVIDLPAFSRIAKPLGVRLAVDNTWAAGHYFKPLLHGADVSVQAVTKYVGGYSDLMMGAIVTREELYRPLFELSGTFGICVSPDDCYVALRGMKSLCARLEIHERNALKIAHWLKDQPEVTDVLHPALENSNGHEIWKRDFTGSSGLFSFALADHSNHRSEEFVDRLQLFGIGSSWGGFESLALPVNVKSMRPETWNGPEKLIRIHVGQEAAGDLIADLSDALSHIGQERRRSPFSSSDRA